MKNKKVFFIFSLVFLLLVALLTYLIILSQIEKVSNLVKKSLKAIIEERLDSKIEIARIKGSFFNKIVLDKVVILRDIYDSKIEIEKVVLKYSLGEFLKKRISSLKIYEIDIFGVSLNLKKIRNNRWNWDNLFRLRKSPYLEYPKIVIKDGYLLIEDSQRGLHLTLKKIYFTIDPKEKKSPFFAFASVGGDKSSLYLRGRVLGFSPLMANFGLIYKDISLKDFPHLFKSYLEDFEEGCFSGKIVGLINEDDKGRYRISYKGRTEFKGKKIKLSSFLNPLENINLEAIFRKRFDKEDIFPEYISISLNKAKYKDLLLYGSLKKDRSYTKIKLSFPKLNIKKIVKLNSLFWKIFKEMEGDLILEVDGKEGIWEGKLCYKDLSYNRIKIPLSFSTSFNLNKRKITLYDLCFQRGSSLKGEIDLEKEELNLELNFKNTPIKDSLRVFRLDFLNDLNLYLNGRIKIKGRINSFNYQSNLKLINQKSRFPFSELRIIFNGRRGKNIFTYIHASQRKGYLKLKGGFQKKLNLWRITSQLHMKDFFLREEFLNSKVRFRGRKDKDKVFGKINVEEFIVNQINLGYANYKIEYQKDILILSTLSSKMGIFIENKINWNEEKFLDMDIDLSNLNLSLLAKSLRLKRFYPFKANIYGKIKITKEKGRPIKLKAEKIKLKKVFYNDRYRMKDVNLNFSYHNGNFNLERLVIGEKDLFLNGDGRIEKTKIKEANFILKADKFPLYNGNLNSNLNIFIKEDEIKVLGEGEFLFEKGRWSFQKIESIIEKEEDKGFRISRLSCILNKEGRLNIKGLIKKRQVLDLFFKIRGIPISTISKRINFINKGSLDLEGEIKGSLKRPIVKLKFKTKLLQIKDKVFKDFMGEANLTKEKLFNFKGVDLSKKIYLKGFIDFKKGLNIEALIDIKKDNLRNLTNLFLPLGEVNGIVEGKLYLKDRFSNLKILAELRVGDLKIKKIRAKEALLEFCYFDDVVSISKIILNQGKGNLKVEKSSLSLKGEENSSLKAVFSNFRIGNLSLKGKIDFFGRSNFYTNKYQGLLKIEDLLLNQKLRLDSLYSEINLEGKVFQFSPHHKKPSLIGKISFLFPEKIIIHRLGYSNGNLLIVEGEGVINLKKKRLRINIKGFDPILEMVKNNVEFIDLCRGKIKLNLSVEGSFDDYHIKGDLALHEGEIITSFKHFKRYTKINAEANLKDHEIKLKYLNFNLNKGRINSYGRFIIPEREIDLYLATEKFLEISIPLKIDSKILANLHITGSTETPLCKGVIEFFDTNFTYTRRMRKKKHPLSHFNFDLKLLAKSNVKYYNNYVKCNLINNSWLRLRGFPGRMKVTGIIKCNKGYIEYLGTNFSINQAKLEFRKGERRPYLYGEAQTKVDNTLILLNYDGKLFVSEPILSTPGIYPPKTKEEIVSMLRLGRDYKNIKKGEIDILLRMSLARLMGMSLNASIIKPLESRLSRLLNLDVEIRIPYIEKILLHEDKDTHPKEDDSYETIFNFGKYITDDLYFNYRGALTKRRERFFQEFELEYFLKPGEVLKYKYTPLGRDEKEEHKISIKKEIKF